MPVDLRTHDPDGGVDITPGTNKARVIKLLYSNPTLGYRPSEVRDRVDVPTGSVTTTLVRLHEDGHVGKTTDGYYHALEGRDDLRRFASALVQAETLASRGGDLSPADATQTKPRDEQLAGLDEDDGDGRSVDAELDALEDDVE
jgi:hypothetical protein